MPLSSHSVVKKGIVESKWFPQQRQVLPKGCGLWAAVIPGKLLLPVRQHPWFQCGIFKLSSVSSWITNYLSVNEGLQTAAGCYVVFFYQQSSRLWMLAAGWLVVVVQFVSMARSNPWLFFWGYKYGALSLPWLHPRGPLSRSMVGVARPAQLKSHIVSACFFLSQRKLGSTKSFISSACRQA